LWTSWFGPFILCGIIWCATTKKASHDDGSNYDGRTRRRDDAFGEWSGCEELALYRRFLLKMGP